MQQESWKNGFHHPQQKLFQIHQNALRELIAPNQTEKTWFVLLKTVAVGTVRMVVKVHS